MRLVQDSRLLLGIAVSMPSSGRRRPSAGTNRQPRTRNDGICFVLVVAVVVRFRCDAAPPSLAAMFRQRPISGHSGQVDDLSAADPMHDRGGVVIGPIRIHMLQLVQLVLDPFCSHLASERLCQCCAEEPPGAPTDPWAALADVRVKHEVLRISSCRVESIHKTGYVHVGIVVLEQPPHRHGPTLLLGLSHLVHQTIRELHRRQLVVVARLTIIVDTLFLVIFFGDLGHVLQDTLCGLGAAWLTDMHMVVTMIHATRGRHGRCAVQATRASDAHRVQAFRMSLVRNCIQSPAANAMLTRLQKLRKRLVRGFNPSLATSCMRIRLHERLRLSQDMARAADGTPANLIWRHC
mmetsp:Transcript_47178/g.131705  ORF Transcript_47178/g.131705 Transcript_47178/m.131705 type:complete len:350 (-) Transcript_47178:185-1234(-)